MSTSKKSVRVFVVEDHDVMREMLCEAVEREPTCTLIGSATSAESALETLADTETDLVLIDVSLPHMSGVELVHVLREQAPELLCLMVSGHVEVSYAEQALAAGASGYVLKGRPEDIAVGIHTAMRGGCFLSEPLQEKLGNEAA